MKSRELNAIQLCSVKKWEGIVKMARNEKLLRSKDVAHILDCSPDDVIALARNERLPAIKVGRFWKFRYADVAAYKRKAEKHQLKGKKIPFDRGTPVFV